MYITWEPAISFQTKKTLKNQTFFRIDYEKEESYSAIH